MPSFPVHPSPTASTHAHSQEFLFRKAIANLRLAAPKSPRDALLTQLANIFPQSLVTKSPVVRAQNEAIQTAITEHTNDDGSLYSAASTAMDCFLAVRIHGARSKTSAFFDRLCSQMGWVHIAILAPSTVAEACFLAVNSRKRLTVIDVGSEYPGREIAARLASQTNAPTRYTVLSSASHALEAVDVLVLGAREVCINGSVICEHGAGPLVQMAHDAAVSVVVATQAVKYSTRMMVDWTADGDVIRPGEISSVVTELDTATWIPFAAPDVLYRLTGPL